MSRETRKYQGLVGIDYRELKRMADDKSIGPEGVVADLKEAMERKDVDASEFRLIHLFEALHPKARELQEEWRGGSRQFSDNTARLLEAGEVRSSQFANITGQIIYSQTLQYYQDEDFIFTKEIPEMASPFLETEKIAGIGRVGNEVAVVGEGEEFPPASPVEDYIHLPGAGKRGQKVQLTWEALFTDRTGDLQKRCQEVGYGLGYDEETRAIDCIVDENGGAKTAMQNGHRYHWRGTSYATFDTGTTWDNVTTSNALVDWTDVEGAELTLSRITDPNTGLVTLTQPDTVVVTKQLEYTARYVIQATSLAVNAGGYNASSTVTRFELANFLPKYKIMTSRLLETRMATDTDWYLGSIKKSFVNKVCRPFKVDQAPDTHPDNFDREIVAQWKASKVSNFGTMDPRHWNESRA